ncbi:MAG: oxygen-independent coproporphyrinogen III oxidase [Bacteroidetes bacterium]|nr:oxygen-independent coproporphyrinogen III oxidase [Bacteroidota bacterium]
MVDNVLLKYNRPGPRYTSYPPATFFHTGYSAENYKQSVIDSNHEKPENISIYIHIPFCQRLCHFCGCNTGIAKGKDHIERYVRALIKEINTVSLLIDKKRTVTQVHWGGGTPNSIPFDFIVEIMETIRANFKLDPGAEIAMECSPAYLTLENIDTLSETGFNRISLGVQDFHREVLDAVNRLPSLLPMDVLFHHIREKGFKSINLDLIYGLPKQTPELFADSINQVLALSPDRLVTFSYAHVPWFNKSMEKLEKIGLPTTEEKFRLFGLAYEMLTTNEYVPVGLDHYAKPSDDLSIALREKKLHRNFQGYCTREKTGQVYAFGSSGISQLWNSYSQNIKDYQQYTESIENHDFAVERGYRLTQKDIICREAINSLMCNGYLNFEEMAHQFGITEDELKSIIQYSPVKLAEFSNNGLVILNNKSISVSQQGMLIVRNIAMTFDPRLENKQGMYSKTI